MSLFYNISDTPSEPKQQLVAPLLRDQDVVACHALDFRTGLMSNSVLTAVPSDLMQSRSWMVVDIYFT